MSTSTTAERTSTSGSLGNGGPGAPRTLRNAHSRGFSGGFVVKLVLMALINAFGLYGILAAWASGSWGILAFLVVALVVADLVYFLPTRKLLPAKYLYPGLIFLLVFQIFVVLYTAATAFTNYGDGHNATKDAAIGQLTTTFEERVEGTEPYAVTVLGGEDGLALAAVQGQTPARAVVLLAAPGEDIGTTIRRQIGQNPANPPALVEESNRILDALGRGERVAEVSPVLAPLFRPSVQPYLISSLRYDPQRLIASQNLPTLIVQGDRDLQVRPEDARLLSAAQPAARTHLARGVNHVLVPAPLDPAANFARYGDAELPLERGVVSAVVEFLRGALR